MRVKVVPGLPDTSIAENMRRKHMRSRPWPRTTMFLGDADTEMIRDLTCPPHLFR